MAYVLANPDGTSNAKVGDIVVTGGGLYEKTESGGKYVGALTDSVAKTSSYDALKQIYNANYSGGGNGGSSAAATASASVLNPGTSYTESYKPTVDTNGIYDIYGYDPNTYAAAYSSSASTSSTLNTIFGYVIVGLVGLVILNRLAG